jgi:hypothetical protein
MMRGKEKRQKISTTRNILSRRWEKMASLYTGSSCFWFKYPCNGVNSFCQYAFRILVQAEKWTSHVTLPPIPVAERSKACVCGRSLAGIECSNPAGGNDVCFLLSVVCCQVEVSASG